MSLPEYLVTPKMPDQPTERWKLFLDGRCHGPGSVMRAMAYPDDELALRCDECGQGQTFVRGAVNVVSRTVVYAVPGSEGTRA